MNEVFNLKRTGLYWWGLLTALIFLVPADWIFSLTKFIREADWLQKGKPPLVWFDNFGTWIDAATKSVIAQVKFDPKEALVFIGTLGLSNLVIALIMAVILILVVFLAYRRAVKTEGIVDDFLAMLIIYIALRAMGLAAESLQVPLIDFLRAEQPKSYLIILLVFMILTLIRGEGALDSRAFFKVLFQIIIVSILIVPAETVALITGTIDIPARFNTFLRQDPAVKDYFPVIMTIWALIGVYITSQNIYTAGKPPVPPKGITGEIDDVQNSLEKLKRKMSS